MHYLAVRLFYETELTGVQARREWNVDGNLPAITQHLENRSDVPASLVSQNKQAVCRDGWRLFHLLQFLGFDMELAREMTKENAMTMLGWLDGFPAELHSPVWLEAYEDSYRDNLLSKLAENRSDDQSASKRPLVQAVFCIDVRSEPFRRHFEQAGSVETFGYAGFFGIPMNHRSYDKDESFDLCPVLLKPSNALLELPREGQQQALENYASGSRWQQFGDHLFHDMKHSPVASFILVDILGLFFSVGLLGKTMLRRPYKFLIQTLSRWFVLPVATKINVGVETGELPKVTGQPIELTRGYSVEQQATFVENGLRTIGLTENLGRFIVLCGHGSTSDNNPYYAALDCGACGGRPGDPNARTFAAMGNHPDIRIELAKRGLNIPDDTWFLPAKHDTNSDRISLYDLQDVPASHQD